MAALTVFKKRFLVRFLPDDLRKMGEELSQIPEVFW
jgi:lipid-A-disaccharide synthase-like uncharacterized protein